MNVFDRVLLGAYALFFTVTVVLFSALMIGWTVPMFLFRDVFCPDRSEVFWPVVIILIIAGARLFWLSLRGPRGRHVVLAESALGQIRVSLQAIENLVEKVVSQIKGVREVKPRMMSVPQGVGIQVRVSVTPDVNVPEISVEIQNRVKERVFAVTGLSVKAVKVSVEDISAHKPRVE
ncbi:MAG: alkaline shock response membrane anchor protein AmaP [Pelotomaculum sp.]|uniref:Uncharacterized protein conserved in bacteria n=1 Tax=Pelotomaculum thermopropionicum (strain DSM 13744 / JCM 10971 / SI) TaxID=370438 RepID=A5D317_PELTS|nr:alkaline shock response membrane anchor protein AmaP [Pelotomaculum sp.]BAF59358.1 Uncharacterized protein conserved in bacteria [Pelotomaculum thermopropionicum SI]